MEQKVDQLVIGDRLLVGFGDVAAEFLLEGEAEDNLKVLLGKLDLVLNALYAEKHVDLCEEDLNRRNNILGA